MSLSFFVAPFFPIVTAIVATTMKTIPPMPTTTTMTTLTTTTTAMTTAATTTTDQKTGHSSDQASQPRSKFPRSHSTPHSSLWLPRSPSPLPRRFLQGEISRARSSEKWGFLGKGGPARTIDILMKPNSLGNIAQAKYDV